MAGFGGLALGAAATAAALTGGTGTDPDRARIEAIVREYILAHPEILPEAMDRLRARDAAKAVAANRAAIETPYANAWEGAADGDVTLVEFFDYACGYCRASLPDIARLLREDPKLKVVYREFPVLGTDSEAASLLALGAARGPRYAEVHRALYASGRPDAKVRDTVARKFGLSPAGDDGRQELDRNRALQAKLGLTGTPAWIVGDQVLSGAVGYDALKAAVAEARNRKTS